MIKVLGKISLLLLIFVLILFISCSKDTEEEFDININEKSFFDKFSKCSAYDDTVTITDINLYYYYNGDFDCYYYEVEYNSSKTIYDYHVLYVYYNRLFSSFFPITDENLCSEIGYDYDNFLIAKEKGIHREYTSEEINTCVEKYIKNEQ